MDNLPFEEQVARVARMKPTAPIAPRSGDDSQPEWKDAPGWQRESAVNGVQFHLAQHQAGVTVSPEASHDSWLAEKRQAGWKYGPVKDPGKKEHPCFVPYGELPIEQRMKDYIFRAICNAFFEGRNGRAE